MLVLVLILGTVLWNLWKKYRPYSPQIIYVTGLTAQSSITLMRSMLPHMVTYVGTTVGILAVGDFFLQRLRFEKSIKQTRREAMGDMKATEGNPAIKGEIRAIQRDRARQWMVSCEFSPKVWSG